MHTELWYQCWEEKERDFQHNQVDPLLEKHFSRLRLSPGARVCLPLCGNKSLSIRWMLNQGYRVVGTELNKLEVEQLFSNLEMTPTVDHSGPLTRYKSQSLEVFLGSILDLGKSAIGEVNAIYDRDGLVSVPERTRDQYSRHLNALCGPVPQLLVGYEYDQKLMDGPPYSIGVNELQRRFGNHYCLRKLDSQRCCDLSSGRLSVHETAWHLHIKS